MFEGDFEETSTSLMESKGSFLTNLESGFRHSQLQVKHQYKSFIDIKITKPPQYFICSLFIISTPTNCSHYTINHSKHSLIIFLYFVFM